jgi:heparosan-N-sulfate-glucuronate 5-epimerase
VAGGPEPCQDAAMRLASLAVLAAAAIMLTAAPAWADYSRNGPYLDYGVAPHAPHGKLPVSTYSFGRFYTPVAIAQYGLRAHANYLATRRRAHRRDVLLAARWFVRHQRRSGAWVYPFRHSFGGFTLARNWVSALGQGQGMSLLRRAYRLKRRRAYKRAARRALGPFSRTARQGGVLADFDGVPWYEEAPTVPPSYILNGFQFALVGLYDVAPWSRRARRLFRRGMLSLRARIDRFDRPGGSFYYPGRPASRYYHRVHLQLLGALVSVRPSRRLRTYYARWYRAASRGDKEPQ